MAMKSSSVCSLEPEKIMKTKCSQCYGTPCISCKAAILPSGSLHFVAWFVTVCDTSEPDGVFNWGSGPHFILVSECGFRLHFKFKHHIQNIVILGLLVLNTSGPCNKPWMHLPFLHLRPPLQSVFSLHLVHFPWSLQVGFRSFLQSLCLVHL